MISEMKWYHCLPDIVIACNQLFIYKERVPSCEHFLYGCQVFLLWVLTDI